MDLNSLLTLIYRPCKDKRQSLQHYRNLNSEYEDEQNGAKRFSQSGNNFSFLEINIVDTVIPGVVRLYDEGVEKGGRYTQKKKMGLHECRQRCSSLYRHRGHYQRI